VVSLRLPLILQLGDALSEQIKDLDSNPAGSGQRIGQGRSGIEGIGIKALGMALEISSIADTDTSTGWFC